jgi:hypothetical protein
MERIKKRLIKELNYEDVTCYEMDYDNNIVNVFYKDRCFISFNIPNYYPFRPIENFMVNNKPVHYYKLGNRHNVRKYFDIQCICCKSLLCYENWKLTKTVKDILDEYDNFKDILNASVLFYYIERKKNLPLDILYVIASYFKKMH